MTATAKKPAPVATKPAAAPAKVPARKKRQNKKRVLAPSKEYQVSSLIEGATAVAARTAELDKLVAKWGLALDNMRDFGWRDWRLNHVREMISADASLTANKPHDGSHPITGFSGRDYWKASAEEESALRKLLGEYAKVNEARKRLRDLLTRGARLLETDIRGRSKTIAETVFALDLVQSDVPIPGKGRWEDIRAFMKTGPILTRAVKPLADPTVKKALEPLYRSLVAKVVDAARARHPDWKKPPKPSERDARGDLFCNEFHAAPPNELVDINVQIAVLTCSPAEEFDEGASLQDRATSMVYEDAWKVLFPVEPKK